MNSHVTQDQFNNQLVLIHQTMRDNQKDSFEQLQIISKDVGKIASSVEKLQLEQNLRLDQHSIRITTVEALSKVNNEHRIITKAYWGISGVVLTAVMVSCVKLLFFPAPPI
jgi:hypothetical protein